MPLLVCCHKQVSLVRTLISMCNTMAPITGSKFVQLGLLYYDDITVCSRRVASASA